MVFGGHQGIKCHLMSRRWYPVHTAPILGLEALYALIASPLSLVYRGLPEGGASGYCCCARAEARLLKTILAIWGNPKALGVGKHILQQLPLLLHQVTEKHEPPARLQLQCTRR